MRTRHTAGSSETFRSIRRCLPRLIALFSVASTGALAGAETLPKEHARQDFWVTDGPIESLAVGADGRTFYAAGPFSAVGAISGHFARVRLTDGRILPVGEVLIGGDALAVQEDGAGGWFVGGDFRLESGEERFLLHFDARGDLTDWDPRVNGVVRSIDSDGSALFVGGIFSSVNGQSRGSLAAFDLTNLDLLPWDPAATRSGNGPGSGFINEVHCSGNNVYLGGLFDAIDGQPRENAASVDAVSGTLDGWAPLAGSPVSAIRRVGDRVYIGGSFRFLNGMPQPYLACTDALTGTADDWSPDIDQSVYTLLESEGRLFVGGRFRTIDGLDRKGLASFTIADGSLDDWSPSLDERDGTDIAANSLARSGDTVYVGGSFLKANGEDRLHVAAFNAGTGALAPFERGAASESSTEVFGIAIQDGVLAAAGNFYLIGAMPRERVAEFDLATGEATAWRVHPSNERANDRAFVNAVYAEGDGVVLGGNFDFMNGSPAKHLVKVDRVTGQIVPGFQSDVEIPPPFDEEAQVTVIRRGPHFMYIGGRFDSVSGEARHNLAAIDPATGAVINGWDGAVSVGASLRTVTGMSVNPLGTELFVAGSFNTAGQMTVDPGDWETRTFIAGFDAATGQLSEWSATPNDRVHSVLHDGSHVWIGGDFRTFANPNGEPFIRYGVAQLRPDNGEPDEWSTWLRGPGTVERVDAIQRRGDVIYLAGRFGELRGGWDGGPGPGDAVFRPGLAAMRISEAEVLDWNPQPQTGAADVLITGNAIVAGGEFSRIGLRQRPHLAVFDIACSSADVAPPFGTLDLADITAFIAGFIAQDVIADVSGDGVFDLADINLFIGAFTAGCP